MMMLGCNFLVFCLTAVIPVAPYLTDDCVAATSGCMMTLTTDLFNSEDFCGALSRYFPCVAEELTAAGGAATCDRLTILTKKVIELDTLKDLTTTNACKISAPSQLQLDACSVELGRCGQSAVQASQASDTPTRCREIEDFITCMTTNTTACQNSTLVSSLVVREITSDPYERDCFGSVPPTASLSPSTTAATTPRATSTTTPRTRGPSEGTQRPFTTPRFPLTASTATTQLTTPTATSATRMTTRLPPFPTNPTASGQSPAITKDDLNGLKTDFQRSLDMQTLAILKAVNQQLQTLQYTLPSKPQFSNLLTSISVDTTQLQHALTNEFQTRFDTLQEHIADLVGNLGEKLDKVQTTFPESTMNMISSQHDYSKDRKIAASTGSCVEKVMRAVGSLSPGKIGSFEHYVKVTRLGDAEDVSGLRSVVVVFNRWEDRMLMLMKGREALKKHKIVMEMFPSHFRFTCAR